MCLSQLYHDEKRGIRSGYAKFETFPVWNLPLSHPVNLAYEAATADLGDTNHIDPFHLAQHHIEAVNYNRDIEAFPILEAMLSRIFGKSPYVSPTEMGVNMVGYCFSDETIIKRAAEAEILRRYAAEECAIFLGKTNTDMLDALRHLVHRAKISPENRAVVAAAHRAAHEK